LSLQVDNHIIPLDGVRNLRELGGYELVGGGETRHKRLLRSDDLKDLTPEAQRFLIDYGVRTVIDLRDPEELAAAPDPFVGSAELRYLHLPFFDDSGEKLGHPDPSQVKGMEYLRWLDLYSRNVSTIFQTIAAAGEGVTLFHCVAGKDRTGLVAGIMLSLSGVPDSLVAEDYAMSFPLLYPELGGQPPQPAADLRDAITPEQREARRKQRMLDVLDGLRSTYGGAVGYLRATGVSNEEIAALEKRLTL
jgi:protein-tyrosine phosphatase